MFLRDSFSDYNNFNSINPSQTQGNADGDNENSSNQSFVEWTDANGSHVDRYYTEATPTSEDQC